MNIKWVYFAIVRMLVVLPFLPLFVSHLSLATGVLYHVLFNITCVVGLVLLFD